MSRPAATASAKPEPSARRHHKRAGTKEAADTAKPTGLRRRVKAFLRGSLAVLARGHRATFGKLLKRGADTGEKSTSRKSRDARPVRNRGPQRDDHAPAVPPADCVWIDTLQALQAFTAEVKQLIDGGSAPKSYIDTEADSLHHFSEKLCLIQLAVGGRFALIDTLAVTELAALFEQLERTEIWLHGADYDLTLLKRTYGWMPSRICDTQIAARLCGHRPFGLAALVERHCGITLCKSSQKADWSRRPLPAKMQAYAVDDVRYLGRLSDTLMEELRMKNRVAWFGQSCAALRTDVLNRPERDPDDVWRISGCGRLRPSGLAVLRALWLWRESMARERDVPPFKILNNQQLLAMVTEFEAEGRISEPPRWRPAWRTGLQRVVREAAAGDPATWPQQPKQRRRQISEAEKNQIEKLCQLRERRAASLGIEPSLLGSRETLMEVVLQKDTPATDLLMPWQQETLGLSGATAAA